MICWHIFNKYLVCFENNDSKCTQFSSIDDNKNSLNIFTDSTSICKWYFLWQRDGDSILVITYDIQACTFGIKIVIFRPIIEIDVLVFLSGKFFLSLLLYNRSVKDLQRSKFSIWTMKLRYVASVNPQGLSASFISPRSMVVIDLNSPKVEEMLILVWKTLNYVHVMVD